jgi:flavin-binding protein dodecin
LWSSNDYGGGHRRATTDAGTNDRSAKSVTLPAREYGGTAKPNGRNAMAVARVSKITAASPNGFQEAIQEGMKRSSKTLRGITGLEVISQKCKIDKGKITEYRVTMEVTFILE